MIDVANLRVGDVVGVDPAYGNDYVATVVKVNKVNIVVEAAGRCWGVNRGILNTVS